MTLVCADPLPRLGIPQRWYLILSRREDQVAIVVVDHAGDGALVAFQQDRPLDRGGPCPAWIGDQQSARGRRATVYLYMVIDRTGRLLHVASKAVACEP